MRLAYEGLLFVSSRRVSPSQSRKALAGPEHLHLDCDDLD
jgi:hypothetical protein